MKKTRGLKLCPLYYVLNTNSVLESMKKNSFYTHIFYTTVFKHQKLPYILIEISSQSFYRRQLHIGGYCRVMATTSSQLGRTSRMHFCNVKGRVRVFFIIQFKLWTKHLHVSSKLFPHHGCKSIVGYVVLICIKIIANQNQ